MTTTDPTPRQREFLEAIRDHWRSHGVPPTIREGLECLKRAGVSPGNVMVYVLVGYDHETKAGRGVITDDDVYRVESLRAWGADPYPMPFVRTRETIGFQRWVCRFALKRGVSWEEYRQMGFASRYGGGPGLFADEAVDELNPRSAERAIA